MGGFIAGAIHNTVAPAQAQTALAESCESLQHMVENSVDATVVIDSGGVACYANKAAALVFGGQVSVDQEFGVPLTAGTPQELDVPRAGGEIATVKMLKDLALICSYCKRIRDDRNYWHPVLACVSAMTEATLAHGLCPERREEHFPDEPADRGGPSADGGGGGP